MTWKFNNQLVVPVKDRIEIIDQLPKNKGYTFSVLKIEPYFPSDFGMYECEAVNSAGAVAYQIPVLSELHKLFVAHYFFLHITSLSEQSSLSLQCPHRGDVVP